MFSFGSMNIHLADIDDNSMRRPISGVDAAKKQTLFNLLFYILSETDFVKIPANEFIVGGKIDNRVSKQA
jgi:hypothetical protein